MRRELVFRGKKISVSVCEARLPSGGLTRYEVVEYPGAVAVLPLKDKDTVLLIRQYRPVIGEWLLEVPAGTLKAGESPEECALRELKEETGYTAGKLVKLAEMYMSPGYSTEVLHVYVASQLKRGEPSPEPSEVIEVLEVPFAEAIRWIERGVIRDAKTIVSLIYYRYLRGTLTLG